MPIQMQESEHKPVISVEDVRYFMLDFPKYNVLLDNFQFTQQEVEHAMGLVVDEFNIMPPILDIVFSIENFPSKTLMLYGVAKHLLMSEALRQQRNQATAQDGDISSLDIYNKYPLFREAAAYFAQEFKAMATEYKISININGAYDSIPSGMAGTSRYVRH